MAEDLTYYAKLLARGEVIAFPTETVYGLGADAWNPTAVRRVFEVKGRPNDNPLIVHVSDIEMAKTFCSDWPDAADLLSQKFWPGPLTLVLPKRPKVLDAVTAGLDTVALRMPNHPLALQLIRESGPLVAPSANTSGRPSPTTPQHVLDDFGADFPVIDGGPCKIGLESTVLNLSKRPLSILRPGYISAGMLEEVLGEKVGKTNPSDVDAPRSPGMKYSHYSPEAEVRWLDRNEPVNKPNTLYLLHSIRVADSRNVIHYQADYSQMARELYDRFRQADREQFDSVAVEPLDDPALKKHDIIDALINRISKATGERSEP